MVEPDAIHRLSAVCAIPSPDIRTHWAIVVVDRQKRSASHSSSSGRSDSSCPLAQGPGLTGGADAMKILITGGTGVIGRALCRALLDAGHQLTVLRRLRCHSHEIAGGCGNRWSGKYDGAKAGYKREFHLEPGQGIASSCRVWRTRLRSQIHTRGAGGYVAGRPAGFAGKDLGARIPVCFS